MITDVGFSDKLTDLEVAQNGDVLAVGRGWGGSFGFPIVVRYGADGSVASTTVTRDVTKTVRVANVDDSAAELTWYARFVDGSTVCISRRVMAPRCTRRDGGG